MLQLTIACLLLSITLLLLAAWLALYQLKRLRPHRWGWAAFSAMLFAMTAQRVPPLEWALHIGVYDFAGAALGLLTACLALAAVVGLRSLFILFERSGLTLPPGKPPALSPTSPAADHVPAGECLPRD